MASIRPAAPRDAPTIRDVARESWHAAYDALLGRKTVEETIGEWYDRASLEGSIDDARDRDDAAFLVAETDAEIAGYAHAVPSREDPAAAYLLRIYVRPDRWGEGVGTALLEALETALAPAFDRLRLVVLADNEVGIAFYEARAFERVETRESGFEDLEEHVYEKALRAP